MIPLETYRSYLIDLKDDLYKVLCLYEEESNTFNEYLDSMLFELYGLKHVVVNLPHGLWYVKTLARLEEISKINSNWEDTKRVKKEIFDAMRRVDKQIDRLKGE